MAPRIQTSPDLTAIDFEEPPHWSEQLRRLRSRWQLAPRIRREAGLIALGLFAAPYVIALLDLTQTANPSWLSLGIRHLVIPVIGFTGAWLLLLPLALGALAIYRLPGQPDEPRPAGVLQGAWAYSLVVILCTLAYGGVLLRQSAYFLESEDRYQVGWIGITLAGWLVALFGQLSARLVLIGVGMLALPLLTGIGWGDLWRLSRSRIHALQSAWQRRRDAALADAEEMEFDSEETEAEDEVALAVIPSPEPPRRRRARREGPDAESQAAILAAVVDEIAEELEAAEVAADDDFEGDEEAVGTGRSFSVIDTNVMVDPEGEVEGLGMLQGEQQDLPFRTSTFDMPYEFPSLRLLNDPPERAANTENYDGVKEVVEQALARYGVVAHVDRITVGPSVTRVECIPEDGTRMAKIQGMENDLRFDLAVKSVRVEAPIPGRKAVGIELPNKVKHLVTLREILGSDAFQSANSVLTVALGKDLAGNCIVADLARMPHLLIAGQTGAGKSVCLNTIIMSLLYRGHPGLVKMILIDPKRVELVTYNGLPHLLVPVVDDARKALNALNWADKEMDDRYKTLQQARVRNIGEYNARHPRNPMPYIVIVIDELADLMALGAVDLEKLINRLARLARAVGIHLILATQRPDVKVITGQIKANIPTRIAFKVPSIVDSKTILDHAGADKLLGYGDMLFKAIGESKPIRAQGCYVDEVEISTVVEAITTQLSPEYNDEILVDRDEDLAAGMESGDEDIDGLGDDAEYYDAALQIALQEGMISASMVQRKLRIGYNRAARIIDVLHTKGIIGGPNGAKPRELLRRDLYESIDDDGFDDESDEGY